MRVSFIVPHLNAPEFLPQCLSALRRQGPQNEIEILLIDNGSLDSPAPIAREYGARLVAETRPGPSFARNRGISEASGEFIAFIDADVVLQPNWTDSCLRAFKRHWWIDCVQSPIIPAALDPHSFMARFRYGFSERITRGSFTHLQRARYGNPILNSAAFIVRAARIKALGIKFNEGLRRCEDMDFTRQLLYKGSHFLIAGDTYAEVFDRRTPLEYLERGYKQSFYKAKVNQLWFATPFESHDIGRQIRQSFRKPDLMGLYTLLYGIAGQLGAASYFSPLFNSQKRADSPAQKKAESQLRKDRRNSFLINALLEDAGSTYRLSFEPYVRIFIFPKYAVVLNVGKRRGQTVSARPRILAGIYYERFLELLESRNMASTLIRNPTMSSLISALLSDGLLSKARCSSTPESAVTPDRAASN